MPYTDSDDRTRQVVHELTHASDTVVLGTFRHDPEPKRLWYPFVQYVRKFTLPSPQTPQLDGQPGQPTRAPQQGDVLLGIAFRGKAGRAHGRSGDPARPGGCCQRRRRVGSIGGKNPLTVSAVTISRARSRSKPGL
jgi:hypothetical protein